MAAVRPSDWLRSRRLLVAASALADLLVRVPADVLTPLVSLGLEVLAPTGIGFVTGWLLFAIALYTFGPLAYGHFEELPRRDTGFRIVFTACVIGIGIALQQLGQQSPVRLFVVPATFLCGGLLLWYLGYAHGWAVTDKRGRAVALIDRIAPHRDVTAELERDLTYRGWLGRVARLSFVLAVCLVLGLPIALAAIGTSVLFYAFPLPDLVLLGWAVSANVLPRISVGRSWHRVRALDVDVEKLLIRTARYATRSPQGMFSTMYAVLGLFASAGYIFIAVNVTPQLLELLAIGSGGSSQEMSAATLQLLWNWTGTLLLLVGAGTIGLWAWIRELRRLPHFLDSWEDRVTRPDAEPPARVRGFVLVPVANFLLVGAFVEANTSPFAGIYALLWPAMIGLDLWTVRLTGRVSTQSVSNEHHWITVGLAIQTGALWIGTHVGDVRDALSGGGGGLSTLKVPVAWMALPILVAIIPLVMQYERRYDDLRRYSLAGVLVLYGLLAASSLSVVPARYRIFALGFVVLGVGCGTLLGIVRYFDL